MNVMSRRLLATVLAIAPLWAFAAKPPAPTDAELKNLVERSYPYVALFNVISGFVYNDANPMSTHGWNRTYKPTGLADARVRNIAGPNNDTLYVISQMDLRKEPVVVQYPAFDSQYVSLETSGLDHYCSIPLSTTQGDFKKPSTVLYYTARTQGYHGEPVKGVDKYVELTTDFSGAFLRVRPHSTEPERYQRILQQIQQVNLQPLSAFLHQPTPAAEPMTFPKYGKDMETFTGNFLEVMQFVVNYTSFDAKNALDQEVLAALAKVGVVPGRQYDPAQVADIDPARVQPIVQGVVQWARASRNKYLYEMFKPKGQISFEAMLALSAIAPVGQPAEEAVYPALKTADGQPLLASKHYVLRMSKAQLPPAKAFWSTTLYDAKNFYLIPNERMKYSVGENAGMQLDKDGGIEIHVSRTQPAGVPAANWLPSGDIDQELNLRLRVYQPDLDKMKAWKTPDIVEVL